MYKNFTLISPYVDRILISGRENFKAKIHKILTTVEFIAAVFAVVHSVAMVDVSHTLIASCTLIVDATVNR